MTLDYFLPGFGLPTIRWSDIHIGAGWVRWRAEYDKTGHEHTTPATGEALAALEEARARNPGNDDAPVLPAPHNPPVGAGSARMHA